MSMSSSKSLIETLLHLPPEERVSIIESLWDSLAKEPASIPMPDWHRDVLDERIVEDEADETPGESWSDLRRRIKARR
jgi:putative addiction module component (TIGR02574 family)